MPSKFSSQEEIRRIDEIAEDFSMRDGFNGYMTKYRVKTILDQCKGKTVLDFASADGYMAEALHPFFERIVCVDGSRELIDRARSRLSSVTNIEFRCSLIEDFESAERFDIVLLSFILEHVIDPVAVISKAASYCNEQGCLFIMVPNAESLHRRIGKKMGLLKELTDLNDNDIRQGHRRVYTPKTLQDDVIKAGLKISQSGTFILKPLSNAQMEKLDREIADAFYEVGKELQGWGSSIFVNAVDK